MSDAPLTLTLSPHAGRGRAAPRLHSFHHRHRRRDLDAVAGRSRISTRSPRRRATRARSNAAPYFGSMSRASAEALGRADLDQIQHHRARAGRDRVAQLVEMLSPRSVLASGNSARPGPPHQVHVLDLDVAGRPAGAFQQEIDPRVPAVLHLAPDAVVAGKLGDRAGRERRADQRIGMRGVDADELRARAEIDLDQFPAVRRACGSGLSDFDSHTREPGAASPIIEPGLATWAVMVSPSGSVTSARKRL